MELLGGQDALVELLRHKDPAIGQHSFPLSLILEPGNWDWNYCWPIFSICCCSRWLLVVVAIVVAVTVTALLFIPVVFAAAVLICCCCGCRLVVGCYLLVVIIVGRCRGIGRGVVDCRGRSCCRSR